MSETIYSVYVCKKIEKLLDNRKILHIERSGTIYKVLKDGEYKFILHKVLLHTWQPYLTDLYENVERICDAYSEFNVTQASLKETVTVKKVKKHPINMKDVNIWIKEDNLKIETVEEEIMPKVIKDTGAKPVIQFPGKFLTVEQSKEIFKANKTSKTKYSWYLDLKTNEEVIALDFYKNTDYSQEDIDWLYTQYKHIYFAFEKNGNEEKPLFDEAKLFDNKKAEKEILSPNSKKSKKVKTVAQSSKKIGSGLIVEKEGVLPIEICRRLWIIFGESDKDDSSLSWWSKEKRVFCDDSKLNEANFVSKVYLKENFLGIDYEVDVSQLNEQEVKHLVNSYIYERSRS